MRSPKPIHDKVFPSKPTGAAILLVAMTGLAGAATTSILPGSPSVRYLGRHIQDKSTGDVLWSWSGSGASVTFDGTSCSVLLRAPGAIYNVLVDGRESGILDLTNDSRTTFPLASSLPQGRHTVAVRLRTEANYSSTRFQGFQIDGTPATAAEGSARRIEFYGNSITCGYGILDSVASHPFSTRTENEARTYAAQAADSLGAERRTVCWSGRGVLQNYGGDTANPTVPKMFGQVMPYDTSALWDFSLWVPQVVAIDLGTNDYSTANAQPDSARFHQAYLAFLDSLHAKYPDAKLVLLDGPMMSDGYPTGLNTLTKLKKHLDNLVAALAKKGATAVHFSLSQQGNLGYGADYHPNLAQAKLNGSELAAFLRGYMGWSGSSSVAGSRGRMTTEIVATEAGTIVRIPAGRNRMAKIVDASGRIVWSSELQAGSGTLLPDASGARWIALESDLGIEVTPLRPRLR